MPVTCVLGVKVPVAVRFRVRLLGLTLLRRERVGAGLLIPRCRSVHTFGMRFPLEVVFLDGEGKEIRRQIVPPRRLAGERAAAAVLEMPAAEQLPGGARRGGGV